MVWMYGVLSVNDIFIQQLVNTYLNYNKISWTPAMYKAVEKIIEKEVAEKNDQTC